MNTNSNAQFLTLLDKSEWLKHVKAVIDTSIFIMEAVNDQCINVVVHCSDGWDRLVHFCHESLFINSKRLLIFLRNDLIILKMIIFFERIKFKISFLHFKDSSNMRISLLIIRSLLQNLTWISNIDRKRMAYVWT